MSLCPRCGHQLPEGDQICHIHDAWVHDTWHIDNRICCDFFHRKIVLSVPKDDDDAYWAKIWKGEIV